MNDHDKALTLDDLLARSRGAAGPTPEATERIWSSIERRMTEGPPPPAGALTDIGPGRLLKWAAGLALAGGLLGAAATHSAGGTAAPSVETPALAAPPVDVFAGAPTSAPAPAPAPPVAVPEELERSHHVPEDMPEKAAPLAPTEATPADRKRRPARTRVALSPEPAPAPEPLGLDAEIRLLVSIRASMRVGDTTRALALIDDHKRQFPHGALVEERTIHEIEALCAAERPDDARRLADEFRAAWPKSPHRGRLASTCATG